ncbi:uncharacterized protein EI97DRAFT_66552 [Westerdykella ornata]|uniref:Uncharacterized protein n=1 Tax=Westerdykella ornata TaxID=318751 RepID=A0A6A6JHR6_WESOR|nr:uncharacterized protein EI97DRAFT_66552 [Westerdykella ornata]KAF2275633.1 hypothetical protein EI97DRAFT_66552 [Westerdykella ornata]
MIRIPGQPTRTARVLTPQTPGAALPNCAPSPIHPSSLSSWGRWLRGTSLCTVASQTSPHPARSVQAFRSFLPPMPSACPSPSPRNSLCCHPPPACSLAPPPIPAVFFHLTLSSHPHLHHHFDARPPDPLSLDPPLLLLCLNSPSTPPNLCSPTPSLSPPLRSLRMASTLRDERITFS